MKTRTITLKISEKVYQDLKNETMTTGLCYGLWNAKDAFLGKLIEKLDSEESEWDCHYSSEEKKRK